MPDQSHLAGQAETTRHRATHLRGDAEGHRGSVRDEHGFDSAPVAEFEDELPGPVRRDLIADNSRTTNGEPGLQLASKLLGEVRHLVEVRDSAPMNPAIQLSG